MRRSFYIIFAIVLVVAVIIIAWLFFFSNASKGGVVSQNPNPFPESPEGSIFRLPRIFGDEEKDGGGSFEITPGEERVLVKIWDKPVAGYIFVERQILEQVASTTISGSTTLPAIEQVRATSSVLFFTDRVTGYIHQYDHKTGRVSQVSNTLVPGVYDATFLSNGRFVVYRTHDEGRGVVVSSLFRIPLTTSSSNPIGLEKLLDLPDNIVSLATNRSGRQLSFVIKTQTGGSLYVMTEDTNNTLDPFPPTRTTITRLPLYEWDLSYGGDVLYMTPKASAYTPGYTIEAFSGRRLVSGKTGLVSVASFDEKLVFSSMFAQAGLTSFFTNRTTGNTSVTPVKTIASKCVFESFSFFVFCGAPKLIPLKKQGLPDDWYQGTVSFSDSLHRVYPDGGSYEVINLKEEAGEDIDLLRPVVDSRGSSLVFTNKRNGHLWFVNIGLLSGD